MLTQRAYICHFGVQLQTKRPASDLLHAGKPTIKKVSGQHSAFTTECCKSGNANAEKKNSDFHQLVVEENSEFCQKITKTNSEFHKMVAGTNSKFCQKIV